MFNGITDAGKKYLAKCQATNKPVTFSSIKLGNGIIDDLENPEQFTDLKSLKKEVSITNKEQIEDAVRLTLEFSNEGIIEGFFLKEFGVYVQDDEQEILYWYINDAMEANWLPPAERAPVKYKYYLNILATNLDSLIINWAGNEFFVTKEFLEQELAKKADHTNLSLLTENKNLPDAINEVFQIINDKALCFKGVITNEATFNEATKTGWYKVKDYRINNMYGFGILYVTKHEQTTLQIFYSHREGIAYRQDWDGNIRSATWTKIGESDLYKLTENFDPNLLYLNDAGTKNVDKVYFDRNRKGLFLCIKQTTGTVNSAQNFVDISNKANYDRFNYLDKLTVPTWYEYSSAVSQLTLEEFLNEKLQKNRKLQIEFTGFGTYEVDMTKVGLFLTSGDHQSKLAEITFIQIGSGSATITFNNISIDYKEANESIHWPGGVGYPGTFKEMTLRKAGLSRFSSKAEWILISKSYT